MGVPINGLSAGVAAVSGENTDGGEGVFGHSNTQFGVHGVNGQGVDPREGGTVPAHGCGVYGESDAFEGVFGSSGTQNGVHGVNGSGSGTTPSAVCGVWGDSADGYGVYGASKTNDGVHGVNGSGSGTTPPSNACGVFGDSEYGYGVYGASKTRDGVHGVSASSVHAAVSGKNTDGGPGIYGKSSGNAGEFIGNVNVSGSLTVKGDIFLPGADCAEQFDVAAGERLEPGTVVVINAEGALRKSTGAYDRRVAGVVSGAGDCKPGIILDRQAVQEGRVPVALVGKVYCKVDAEYSSIEVGDLLTTSPTPGHAMRASDQGASFGSVLGKALRPLQSGQGLIPVLVALQ
jgi:hypothetical protein